MQFYIGNCGQIPPRVKVKLASQLKYDPPNFVNRVLGLLSEIRGCNYTWLSLQTNYKVYHLHGHFQGSCLWGNCITSSILTYERLS